MSDFWCSELSPRAPPTLRCAAPRVIAVGAKVFRTSSTLMTTADAPVPSLDAPSRLETGGPAKSEHRVSPLVLPVVCASAGMALGVFRGGRMASLRFLAENAHRAPKTVKGWYFYNKTKNYRMMFGGLKEGGKDAVGRETNCEDSADWMGARVGQTRCDWKWVGCDRGTVRVAWGLCPLRKRGDRGRAHWSSVCGLECVFCEFLRGLD